MGQVQASPGPVKAGSIALACPYCKDARHLALIGPLFEGGTIYREEGGGNWNFDWSGVCAQGETDRRTIGVKCFKCGWEIIDEKHWHKFLIPEPRDCDKDTPLETS